MTEKQIGLLYKLASVLPHAENEDAYTILSSYYLSKCKDITRGYGLPSKQFSPLTRCSHCCLEWSNQREIKVKPIKTKKNKRQKAKNLIHNKHLDFTCPFCSKTTSAPLLRAKKLNYSKQKEPKAPVVELKKTSSAPIKSSVKNVEVNVYSKSKDVFSLQNNKNSLQSSIKEPVKVIKNNKKKKDIFAGLCKQAVLASAKLKDNKVKNNKLQMFLKPSS